MNDVLYVLGLWLDVDMDVGRVFGTGSLAGERPRSSLPGASRVSGNDPG